MVLKRVYNKLVLNKAKKICKEVCPYVVGTVLDVGAGRGIIAKEVQKAKKTKVHCLDVKDLRDAYHLPFQDNSFDSVMIVYVLHHTTDPKKVLQECVRVAKKRIIVIEDDAHSKLTKVLDYTFNKLHGVDVPLNFKTEVQWRDLFKELGLKVIKFKRGIEKQWFYPGVDHFMFVLEKEKLKK